MNRTALLVIASAFIWTGAHATVYNLSATNSPRTFTGITVDSFTNLEANGVSFSNGTLGSLTYIVTPFDGATTQGDFSDFTAAKRFSNVSLPQTGWEWNYWVQIDNAAPYQVGFGGALGDSNPSTPPPWNGYGVSGVPAVGGPTAGNYTSTDALAFATAPNHSFNLAAGQTARVYWLDDNWGDNTGGVSINVTVVPEPEAYMLAMAALGVLGVASRRKTVLS